MWRRQRKGREGRRRFEANEIWTDRMVGRWKGRWKREKDRGKEGEGRIVGG